MDLPEASQPQTRLQETAVMIALLFGALVICGAATLNPRSAQENVQPNWNLPSPVWQRFQNENLLSNYEISTKLNPFYLRGDFDGDEKPDYAILLMNRASKAIGIAMVRSRARRIQILGAGGIKLRRAATSDGSPSFLIDDFGWVDAWHIVTKQHLKPTGWDKPVTPMVGEGIEVEKSEASSALIYWDGKRYRWLQDSD